MHLEESTDQFGIPTNEHALGSVMLPDRKKNYEILQGLSEESDETKLVTTPLFGESYSKGIERTHLTHAAIVDSNTDWDNWWSLCRKTKNIMDDATQWTTHPPTCKYCLPKWKALKVSHPEYLDWDNH